MAGKILGTPVYNLRGGKFRDKIPVASEIGIDTPDANDMAHDVKRIHAVREAVGENIALRLDPNVAWNTKSSIKVMKEVGSCHLPLLEQPISGWDLRGMAHIRNLIYIPVMVA